VLARVAVAVEPGLGRELADLQGGDEAAALRLVEAGEERARREGGEGIPGLLLRPLGQARLLVNGDGTAARRRGEAPTRDGIRQRTRRNRHLR
jgi:hypothetical protein